MKILLTKVLKILIILQYFKLIKGVRPEGPCKDFYAYACHNYSAPKLEQQLENEFNKEFVRSLRNNIDDDFYKTMMQTKFMNNSLTYFESCSSEKGNLTKYLEEIKPLERINEFSYWTLLGKIQSYGLNDIIVSHNITTSIFHRFYVTLMPVAIDQLRALPAENEVRDLLEECGFKDIENKLNDLKVIQTQWLMLTQEYDNATLAAQRTRLFFGRLPWYLQEYIQNMLPHVLDKRDIYVTLYNPKYFEYLTEKNHTLDAVKRILFYLQINFLYYLKDQGPTAFTVTDCAKDFRSKFIEPANAVYMMNFFSNKASKYYKALELLPDQVKAFVFKLIEENQLNLSQEQMQYLLNKINKTSIDFDIEFNANRNVQEYYNQMPVFNQNNYYKNHLLLLKYNYHYFQEHYYYVSNFNVLLPFYDSATSKVKIPLKSFYSPLLNHEHTPVQRVSLFGFTLAREMTRAINNETLANDHLEISNSIINHNNFTSSLKCLSEQTLSEHISERISDLLAVRVAYNLYEEHYANTQKNRTRKFFKTMAKYFCGEGGEMQEINLDAVRLREIVKNFEPFAEAFQCPVGSAMNPVKKCRLY